MPRITEIHIQNFKSLRDVQLNMRPLNILIGENNSGKSNFLSFFEMMRYAADENLNDYINTLGGFSEVVWRGERRVPLDSNLSWKLDIENLLSEVIHGDDTRLSWEVTLSGQGKNAFRVTKEKILSQTAYSGRNYEQILWAGDGTIFSLKNELGEVIEEYDPHGVSSASIYQERELILAQRRDPKLRKLDTLRKYFADWVIYHGFGTDVLQEIRQTQKLNVVHPFRVHPAGRDLVSILHVLHNEARYERNYQNLVDAIQMAFPDFKRFEFRLTGSGSVALYVGSQDFQGESFAASELSDGILRFLMLATLLLLPEPPALIAIDEPEIGLHPKLLPYLGGLLKQASAHTQIIVSTHSPQLLSAEAIELQDIVLVERRDGATVMQRADSQHGLERWLDRYTLGQLWTMGRLEIAE